MKNFFYKSVTLFCSITILISGYKIIEKLSNYKKANQVYTQIRNIKDSLDNTKGNKEDLINNFNILSSVNSDYRFWIQIENTNIDYPVVQYKDNDFYLHHDFHKNKLPSGSIFLDYRNNFDSDYNSIIYGHHMKNSTMFGEIEKFKDEKFFHNNKYITITTRNNVLVYEIFAIGVFDSNFKYNKTSFLDKDDFNNFLNIIIDNSMYSRPITDPFKQIITLSTCSYEFDNARTALFAIRKDK